MSSIGRDPMPEAAGFVLAGGRSSRMGADKALVMLRGQPLVAHALAILRKAGFEASLAGARSSLETFAPVIEDPEPDRGPLGGICAALASTPARLAVFLPVDLPFVPVSLVSYLVEHARITGAAATLTSLNGFAETFPVVIDRAALPVLRRELDSGRGGCIAAFRGVAASLNRPLSVLPVELLAQAGQVAHPAALPAFRWFLNLNAPGDLSRASDQVI